MQKNLILRGISSVQPKNNGLLGPKGIVSKEKFLDEVGHLLLKEEKTSLQGDYFIREIEELSEVSPARKGKIKHSSHPWIGEETKRIVINRMGDRFSFDLTNNRLVNLTDIPVKDISVHIIEKIIWKDIDTKEKIWEYFAVKKLMQNTARIEKFIRQRTAAY